MKDMDIDYAMGLCMEYKLLTPLMFLCSHREDSEGADFLTPIAQALSVYKQSLEEKNPAAKEYGLKFLWFLDMAIQGKMFPSGEMPEDIWEEKVRHFKF